MVYFSSSQSRIAPNLITTIGFLSILASFALSLIYIPSRDGGGPLFPNLAISASFLVYLICRTVSGKHAQRTGSVSPLGEIFKHGVDALSFPFVILVHAAGMGLGSSWYPVYVLAFLITSFYLSNWVNYHTHSNINGIQEGLFIAMYVLLVGILRVVLILQFL
jgi:ethanolaminephosphotransferase